MAEESLFDVTSLCRTCMSNRSKIGPNKQMRRNICDNPPGCQDGPTIMDLLLSVKPEIHVHEKDKLPKVICCDCVELLQVTYDFLQMYKDTDEKLRKMLKLDRVTTPVAPDTGPLVIYKEENHHIVESPTVKIEMDETEENCSPNVSSYGGAQDNEAIVKLEIEMGEGGNRTKYQVTSSQDSEYDAMFGHCEDEDNDYILGDWGSIEASDSTLSQTSPQDNSTELPPKRRRKEIEKGAGYRNSSRYTIDASSDLEASLSYQSNSPCPQVLPRASDTEFLPLVQSKKRSNRTDWLPSIQDIREMYEVKEWLKCQKLENKHRIKIAKAIILFILRRAPNRKLVREDFMQLADMIIEIFPSEVKETYYVPFTNGRLARGKLFDAYNNTKTRLRSAGILPKSVRPSNDDNQISESGSDLEGTMHTPNNKLRLQTVLALENTHPIFKTDSLYGDVKEAGFPFNQKDYKKELPTTQEIKEISEIQNILSLGRVENKHRTQISKAIISHIQRTSPDRRLVKDDFMQLAQSIVEIFPTEIKDTYYIPYQKGNLSRGKLYDCYNNSRTRLHAAGHIRRRLKAKSRKPRQNESIIENVDDVDESDLEILKSESSSDWDLVLSAWKKSHKFRQNELRNENMKTIDYLNKYKVLLNEKNYELFNIDFKMLYPTSKNIYEWKMYYSKVITKAEKIHDRWVKELISDIKNTKNEDSMLALSFILMPYLLPNHRKRSKLEVQESFISHFKLTHRDSDKELQIQDEPKIYLFCDNNNTIERAYVDICGKRLQFVNPMQAIETCFHCIITMNISYPNYCAHIWLFIQKLIFDVTTPWDIPIPSITTLINDLK